LASAESKEKVPPERERESRTRGGVARRENSPCDATGRRGKESSRRGEKMDGGGGGLGGIVEREG